MFDDVVRELICREKDSNKYDFGHVLILGGAPGMVGAPMLCANGALRIGAGLVTIASSPEVIDKLERRVLEIMTLRIRGSKDEKIQTLTRFIIDRRVKVLVAGPGFDCSFQDMLFDLLTAINIPVILDAGAITSFSSRLDEFRQITSENKNVMITPHDGELRKLLCIEIPKDPLLKKGHAISVARDLGVTLVWKGYRTLVVDFDGEVYENQSGSPALASAGTGDVLAGIIAGLISQGINPVLATKFGVYIHGLAGEHAGNEKTDAGVIASDVIERLPKVLKYLSEKLT